MFNWRRYDCLSVKPKLYISGQERFHTKCGFISTIMSIMVVIGFLCYYIIDYFQRSPFILIIAKETNFNASITLPYYLYRLRDRQGNTIDPRIASVTPYLVTNTEHSINKFIKNQKCEFENKYKEINANINEYTCLNSNISLYSNDTFEQYYNFMISRCKNGTDSDLECLPDNIINDALEEKDIYFEYITPYIKIDHYNYEDPLTESHYIFKLKISKDYFYNYHEYNKMVIYDQDVGYVFQDVQTTIIYDYDELHSYLEYMPKRSDGLLASVKLGVYDRWADHYGRYYDKIQSIPESIGGLMEFLIFIGEFLCESISEKIMFIKLSNKIIDHEKEEEEKRIRNSKMLGAKTLSTTSNKSTRSNGSGNKKKLSVFEAILPQKLASKNSARQILDHCEEIIKKKLSCEYLLGLTDQFSRLKHEVLDKRQVEKLKTKRRIEEHINEIRLDKSSDDSVRGVKRANTETKLKTTK